MFPCFWINYKSSQAEINHVHDVARFAHSHDEVIRLDVAMNVVLTMEVFCAFQELVEKHQCRF